MNRRCYGRTSKWDMCKEKVKEIFRKSLSIEKNININREYRVRVKNGKRN